MMIGVFFWMLAAELAAVKVYWRCRRDPRHEALRW